MKRLFKIFFIIIVLPILLGALVLWAIVTFFPQEKLRSYAADQIGRSIHRELQIGTIHLRLNGITFDHLNVSETPNFKAGSLFEAKGVRMGWDLHNLIHGLNIREGKVTQSGGSFEIQQFRNPHYAADNFKVKWSLSGIDNTGTHLDGWIKLDQGPGALKNIDRLVERYPTAKAALTPVLAVSKLERSGIVKLGLPDLRHWPLESITGDYRFDKGLMTIKDFEILSAQMNMKTTGSVTLATGALNLDVQLHGPKLDAQLKVGGTTANPKVDLSTLKKKAFQATLDGVLKSPNTKKSVNDALQNLFK